MSHGSGDRSFLLGDGQGVHSGSPIPVVLTGGQLLEVPLVPVVIVVVEPVINQVVYLRVGIEFPDEPLYVVFHMTEERFLRRVIPAVALPRHGLEKVLVFQLRDEGGARVVAPLVAVHDHGVIELKAVLRHQQINRLDNEIDLECVAQAISQDLVRGYIDDGRQIAHLAVTVVVQVGDVGEQAGPGRPPLELALDEVGSYRAGFHSRRHLPVRVRLSDRTD